VLIIGVDIETSSLATGICEFAAIGLDADSGREVLRVASLVNPGPVEWQSAAMQIHGITPAMVQRSPSLLEVWADFRTRCRREALNSRIFAHNAPFERRHLQRSLGPTFDVQIECTLALAKSRFESTSYRLPVVCSRLGIPFHETHRAEPDARASALVARTLLTHSRRR